MYVANRTAVIHAGSKVCQWSYVPSELNPVDDITKSLAMQDLVHNRRWFKGPDYMATHVQKGRLEPPVVNIEDNPEVKRAVTTCTFPDREKCPAEP